MFFLPLNFVSALWFGYAVDAPIIIIINRFHRRYVRKAYNDKKSSFKEVLKGNSSVWNTGCWTAPI